MSAKHKKPDQEVLLKYVHEIDRFAQQLLDVQKRIQELEEDSSRKRDAYESAKAAVREERDVEHATVTLLLKFIRPGAIETYPLLDQMEPADEEKHGSRSGEWRKEPISVLRLSAAAIQFLIAAEIVLVGQLQDAILAQGEWFQKIEGMSAGMADGVELKLTEFINEQVKK